MSSAGAIDQLEVIHAYIRADAIADGVLHDVTELAAQQGMRYPVAIATTRGMLPWPGTRSTGRCRTRRAASGTS